MDSITRAAASTTSVATDPSTAAAHARWMAPHNRQRDTSSSGLRVLAAGLWRCQTSSLQTAFETLLGPDPRNGDTFKPSMHGSVILTDLPLLKLNAGALGLAERDREGAWVRERRREMLGRLFAGFNASSDLPGMAFVGDLLEMYPGVKVVLNKRQSAREWAKSADVLRFFSTWTYAVVCGLIPLCRWHRYTYWEYEKMAKRRFGKDTDIWAPEYYHRHNQWVKEVCREKGVECLEWEASMGWEPLCKFLGVEVPKEKFPVSNETKDLLAIKPWLVKMGLASWVAALAVVGGVWFAARWYFGP